MASIRTGNGFDLVLAYLPPRRALQTLQEASENLRSLYLWLSGLRSFEVLGRFKKLEALVVFDWPAPDLKPLAELKRLRKLRILHLPNVRDLAPLSRLRRLQELELASLPSWDASGKRLVFRTLAPLGSLKTLRRLSLFGVSALDGRLDVLATATSLRPFGDMNSFSLAAIAALSALRPDLRPKVTWTSPDLRCKRCGGPQVHLMGLRGTRRKAWLCRDCNAERIAAHTAEFKRLIAEKLCRRRSR